MRFSSSASSTLPLISAATISLLSSSARAGAVALEYEVVQQNSLASAMSEYPFIQGTQSWMRGQGRTSPLPHGQGILLLRDDLQWQNHLSTVSWMTSELEKIDENGEVEEN